MLMRQKLLMVVATGALVLPLAAPSYAQTGTGNNNGNGNIGSGNGNCNSGNNNGNNNVGNNKGNGSAMTDEQLKVQMKKLQEQLRNVPLGEDFWKMMPDCFK
jgi:hypothetical protein